MPLGWYRSFKLEHEYHLSNQSPGDWFKDELKSSLLSLLLVGAMVQGLYFLLHYFSRSWWFLAAVGWLLITVLLARVFPVLILPLFYKLTPLEDVSLKKRLMDLVEKTGMTAINAFKMDMGAKTRKANAALMGVGRSRRVVLGDTLLENFSSEEIEVVLAHELGHHKLRHIAQHLVLSTAAALGGFYLIHLSEPFWLSVAGVESVSSVAAFPLICLILTGLSLVLMPLQNGFSRVLERQADQFALSLTGRSEDFISCMEKLALQNLADPTPHPFVEWFFYDHPAISKRLAMGRAYAESLS